MQLYLQQEFHLDTCNVSTNKINDADVWKSLNKSKHIEGEPNEVLRNRLLKRETDK